MFWHTAPCAAQTGVRFERITVDNGLSQSSVTSVIQGAYGYLWIATLDGLNRYDGSNFKVYRKSHNNEHSLYSNRINNLFMDNDQNLWLAYSGVMGRYNSQLDNFSNFPVTVPGEPSTHFVVHDFDQLNDSVALLSTTAGIIEFNTRTGKASRSPVYSFFNAQNISSFFRTPAMGDWVVTTNAVYTKSPGSVRWLALLEDTLGIDVLYSETTDEIYLQTINRLLKYHPGDSRLRCIDEFQTEENFFVAPGSMKKLSDGTLWVMRRAIYVYDEADRHRTTLRNIPQNPHSLSGDLLTCIYETADNVIWVGTNGFGLNKHNPALSVFKYMGTFCGAPLTLSDNYVDAIFTTDDILLLIGTIAGLDVLDLENNTSRHYALTGKDRLPARVNRIFQDEDGNTWLCTTKGVMGFDGRQIRFSGLPELDNPGLNVYDVAPATGGACLLTTANGLYRWHPRNEEVVKTSSFSSMPIEHRQGEHWVESDQDIRVLRNNGANVRTAFSKNSADSSGFPKVPVKCFYADSEGQMWIGSWGGGLSLYDTVSGGFRHFREESGLPNPVVYGILEDSVGNLWLSTNNGICVFNKKKKTSIRNFDKNDGLQGNEFNTRASFRSASGTFYFGGINGLTIFKPGNALQIRSIIPKSIITGFFINHVPVDRLKSGTVVDQYNVENIQLHWDERNFGFEIAGLGFNLPSRTRFMYMLENFDPSWNYMGHERRISFTNIPPGRYTLRVRSSNSFGDWEEEGLAIGITIKAPFWKTRWFVALVVVAAAGLIYFIYYQRTVTFRKRAERLARLVNERTLEIQVKNEEIAAQSETLLLQNKELTTIKSSLEEKVEQRTRVLKNLNKKLVEQNIQLEQFTFITAHNIRGPVARIKGLAKLLPGNTEEMVHLSNSIQNLDEVIADLGTVLNVRHGADHLSEPVALKAQLMQAIQTLQEDIRKKDATIDVSRFDDLTINGIKPYFYSIFYNLIHNALKYSEPSRKPLITCSCKKSGRKIILVVSDNGIGIDMKYAREKIFTLYQRFRPEIKGKGFGLFLIKTQVESMGGRITAESTLNKGTTFTISFRIKPIAGHNQGGHR